MCASLIRSILATLLSQTLIQGRANVVDVGAASHDL
jgi:hypothetical protein